MTYNFCLECWNEANRSTDTEDMFIMSDRPHLCSHCSVFKRVILLPAHPPKRGKRLVKKEEQLTLSTKQDNKTYVTNVTKTQAEQFNRTIENVLRWHEQQVGIEKGNEKSMSLQENENNKRKPTEKVDRYNSTNKNNRRLPKGYDCADDKPFDIEELSL